MRAMTRLILALFVVLPLLLLPAPADAEPDVRSYDHAPSGTTLTLPPGWTASEAHDVLIATATPPELELYLMARPLAASSEVAIAQGMAYYTGFGASWDTPAHAASYHGLVDVWLVAGVLPDASGQPVAIVLLATWAHPETGIVGAAEFRVRPWAWNARVDEVLAIVDSLQPIWSDS